MAQCLPEGDLASSLGLGSLAEDSCCQFEVCGLPCPAVWEPRSSLSGTYGAAVICAVLFFTCLGIATMLKVKGKAEEFFVCGRSLPLFVVSLTLASQSLDSNATLGNADLAYKFHFWDGAVLPIGLGLSLLLNAIFLARKIHAVPGVFTLPDVIGRHHGPAAEVIVSLIECVSFLCLLAGNFVGMARIFEFLFSDLNKGGSVFLIAILTALYTGAGGLYSVAYTDVIQVLMGISGLIVAVTVMMSKQNDDFPSPSVGFPDYAYPPDGDACELYNGVPGTADPESCVYNSEEFGPDGVDNGAYPYGDKKVFNDGMEDFDAYAPFPNAMFFNWATIFILGFGNLAALDFQARVMASKTAKIATLGNLVGAGLTFGVGIPFGLLAGLSRLHYGPDSQFAEFEPNTCSSQIGLPSCAQWLPDKFAFLRLVTTQFPTWLGCWTLIGIVAASMSTSDGAILAISTVLSHNIGRKLLSGTAAGRENMDKYLLLIVRVTIVPVVIIAAVVATLYNETGYLLIVAFDIVLAGVVPAIFACFYGRKLFTNGGILAGIIAGSLTRVVLEYALPKDGDLVLPVGNFSYGYGDAQPGLPEFFDVPAAEHWDPSTCDQPRLEDWTGLDSLLSPVVNIVLALIWSLIEKSTGKSLWGCLPKSWVEPSSAYYGEAHAGKENAIADMDDTKTTDKLRTSNHRTAAI